MFVRESHRRMTKRIRLFFLYPLVAVMTPLEPVKALKKTINIPFHFHHRIHRHHQIHRIHLWNLLLLLIHNRRRRLLIHNHHLQILRIHLYHQLLRLLHNRLRLLLRLTG
ncbi:hypothetical protein X975_05108, partial [Stegodyphus mimosarum]